MQEGKVRKQNKVPDGLKSGVVYTVSTLITRGLAIITVPIFTRLMTSEQVGIVNIYNSWYSLISVVATLSLTSGGYQLALKKFGNDRDRYESSVLSITSIVAIVLSVLYFLFPDVWVDFLGLPENLIVLMLIGFLVTPARDFWMARQRFEYKYKLSGAISIITAVLASAFSVFTVIYMAKNGEDSTAVGRLVSNYIVIYGFAAFFWVYIFLKGKTFYNKSFWAFSLQLSIPLVGYSLAKQVLDVSDRLMISRLVGNSAVGIYSTLYTVSSISLVAWNAINASFVPYLFKNIDSTEEKNKIRTTSNLLLELYAVIAIVLTFAAPEIVKILATDEYYEAIYIMPPIASGIFLTATFNMYSNVLINYKKTKSIMYPSILAALLNIVLNYIFITSCGYKAAAYTTLVSYIFLAASEGVISTKVYKKESGSDSMIYDNTSIARMSVLVIIISLSSMLLYSTTFIRYVICGGFIAIYISLKFKKIRKLLLYRFR